MKGLTKLIYFAGGIFAALISLAAMTLFLQPGHSERGSGRKTHNYIATLAATNGDTQPDTKGDDPKPDPGDKGRKD